MSGSGNEPPLAPREAKDVTVHGDPRIDDWFWLRDRDDPRTLEYLKAENAWADAWFAPHAALKETLYQEMFSRIQQRRAPHRLRRGGLQRAHRRQSGVRDDAAPLRLHLDDGAGIDL